MSVNSRHFIVYNFSEIGTEAYLTGVLRAAESILGAPGTNLFSGPTTGI